MGGYPEAGACSRRITEKRSLHFSDPGDVLVQYSPALIPSPIIERLFTFFIHVFAVVLVVYAVRSDELRWLWLSVLLKVVTDSPIPLFTYYFKFPGALYFIPIEAYVAVPGVISLAACSGWQSGFVYCRGTGSGINMIFLNITKNVGADIYTE